MSLQQLLVGVFQSSRAIPIDRSTVFGQSARCALLFLTVSCPFGHEGSQLSLLVFWDMRILILSLSDVALSCCSGWLFPGVKPLPEVGSAA